MTRKEHGTRRWGLAVVAAMLSLALIAGACGDDDDDGDDADPTSPAAESTTGAAPTEAATEEASATQPAAEGDTILVADSPLGAILTDAEGLTLYTFANDVANSGESACVDACVNAWPPATVEGEPTAAAEATGEVGTIDRADGTAQVTYNGLPLYRFVNDAAPGDTKGDGLGGVWAAAKP